MDQRYYEIKLDVYKQTGDKQTDRQETDLVLEVTPPEVGHLKKFHRISKSEFTSHVLCIYKY